MSDVRWMVVYRIDSGPIEVATFDWYADAHPFYARLRSSFTEVYLTQVLHGPGPAWPSLEVEPGPPVPPPPPGLVRGETT